MKRKKRVFLNLFAPLKRRESRFFYETAVKVGVIRKAALRGLPSPFGWTIADSAGIDPIFHLVHLSLRYNTIIQFFRKKINGFSKENII